MDNFENDLKNIETDTTSGSPITSIDNTFSDNNVRNRVSSWLTEIVGEVRKKGASVSIQNWVDNSNTSLECSTSVNNEDNEICDNTIAQEIKNLKLDENSGENSIDNNLKVSENIEKDLKTDVKTTIESENSIPPKFWNKFSFDRGSVIQNRNSNYTIDKVSQIKTFSKTKFSEFYERVKISKEKLPILGRSPSTMDETLTTTLIKSSNEKKVDENLIENFENQKKDDVKLNENVLGNEIKENKILKHIQSSTSIFEENENSKNNDIEINSNVNISEGNNESKDQGEDSNSVFNNFEENVSQKYSNISIDKKAVPENKLKISSNENDGRTSFTNFRRNLKLGILGRSSTLNPKYYPDDDNNSLKYEFPTSSSLVTPIDEEQILTTPTFVSSTPSSKSKKRHLPFSAIYRSFSEQQPDVIDESEEFLNERSHSCYQVTDGQDSDNRESKINNEPAEAVNIIQNIGNKRDDKSNISTSLPTFSTASMMQHIKSSRKAENNSTGGSYGDSSSSLCMDISPCGSGSGTSTSDHRELYLRRKSTFLRDNSYQSDSSHCSSVDSLLESRKPDPETILINLGFGPIDSEDILAKIPKRFLKPSQVRGIDTEAFLRRQQLMNSIHDHSVLGYRGLIDPEKAYILQRFRVHKKN
ncbi:putative uncharacterized protein DDB_G0291812 isoform X2 [Condylostylus longicornis]|uniref:putative uncharacterized protein DDB_G0291812 isoform X2 n=1 Tax=Condylostylus longicornis TaxID=2530218 RepID=UPI00244DD9B9|nr:putative uncharacterized protein DDB_G0291812 isoform X2 [Condylostylus longicornis]